MAEPAVSIGTRMARGAAWMVALRTTDRLLGFVSMFILARLLLPEDFGLVALAMAIMGSLAVFSEFGFEMALIQNQDAKRQHYDTVWTLGLLRGLLLTGLLLLLARPLAVLFDDEQYVGLISTLAFLPLLEGLGNPGVVNFRKHMIFRKEFIYRLSSRLIGVITTIVLAFFWRNYWALVAGTITSAGLRFILGYGMEPYRPRLSLRAWKELFHFSKWLLLNGILGFSIARASTFVVGSFLNASSIGIMSLSGEIAGLIQQAAIAPLKRAFFPGYAKLANRDAIKEILLRTHGIVVFFAAPAAIGIGLTAKLFVPILLGERWLETISIIQILACDAFLVAMQGQVRPAFLAINKPAVTTYLSAIYAFTLVPALIIGVQMAGLVGVAWAAVAARLIQVTAEYYALNLILEISFPRVIRKVWRSLLACAGLAIGVIGGINAFVSLSTQNVGGQIFDLAFIIMIGVGSYLSVILILWYFSGCPEDSTETTILKVLKR